MLVQPAEQIVLHYLISLGLFIDAEIHAILEILLHQEKRFIRVRGGSECGDGLVAIFLSNRVEPGVNKRQCVCSRRGLASDNCGHKAGPSFERVEAETAFVAKPALVHSYVAPADGTINLSVARGV